MALAIERKCHDWTNDDGIGNRLAGGSLLATGAQAHVAEAVVAVARRRTRGGGGSAQVPWVLRWRSCWWLWRRSHGWSSAEVARRDGPNPLWLWKTWFRRHYDYGAVRITHHTTRPHLHHTECDPIRELPPRGFEILMAHLETGETRNASSPR